MCNCCLNDSYFDFFPYDDHLNVGNEIKNHIPMDEVLFSRSFNIKKCRNCGYGVYDRDISEEELKVYYQFHYKNWNATAVQHEINDPLCFLSDVKSIGQYNFIKDYLSDVGNEKILEIGAGAAHPIQYIKHFKQSKPGLFVIEPGELFTDYYHKLDINKISDYFPSTLIEDDEFDYIHASHWLEHVVDLGDTLQNIKRILKSGGLMFLEVPNCGDHYFENDIKDTPHIHFFTRKAFVELSKKYKFEILKMDSYWLTFEQYFRRDQKQLDYLEEDNAKQNSMNDISSEKGAWLRVLIKNQK